MSMKKIGDNLYKYKGYEVRRDSEGNYIAKVKFANLQLKGTVLGSSQRNFIKMFKQSEEQWGKAEVNKDK